jgi:hypothetical protein
MRRLFVALLILASTVVGSGYWDRYAYHYAGGDSPAVDRAV